MAANYPCPNCGTAYALTPEYMAQFGGQATTCVHCQRTFTLPAAGSLPPAFPQFANAPYAQAAPQAYPGGFAGGPTMPGPAGGPAQVLPYAGPAYAPTAGGVWVEGPQIVAQKEAVLPDRCVKCNAPADGPPRRKVYYWHEGWLYVTILAGLLIYAILALILRKQGAVSFALCPKHRSRRLYGILAGWGSVALGIGMFVAAGVTDTFELVPLGIVVLIVGAIAGLLTARVLMPTKIDDHYVWLRGAGREFLATLPPVPGPGGYGYAYGQPPYGQPAHGYAPQATAQPATYAGPQ